MSLKKLFPLFSTVLALAQAAPAALTTPQEQSRFSGVRSFADFNVGLSTNASEVVLLSPVFKAPIAWNELVVSWNATAPTNSWLKVEAQAIYPGRATKFYTLAIWSKEASPYQRAGGGAQIDNDGRVNTDTLVMNQPGADVQVRLTLTGLNETSRPQMKFLGLSFFNNRVTVAPMRTNHTAWGKTITTPELSQKSYPQEQGWCSPTSLSMVLTRWSQVMHRPDLNVDVPVVAAGVYDKGYGTGTGNWAFNAAYAGSFPGMRAYVTRFSDVSEIAEWINAGIPVIISAPERFLNPDYKDKADKEGHLTVVIGFNNVGDVIINDPAANLKKGQIVRRIYKRENVINAWSQSRNTVYLVYPESAQIPADSFGQWEQP